LLQKIDVEVRTAKLVIGEALQAQTALKFHDLSNGAILDRAQLFGGNGLALKEGSPGLQHVG
jgi:hypothetical protein